MTHHLQPFKPEYEDQAQAAVEDALRTLPLTPAPPRFLHSVMQQVRQTPPLPVFRLTWIDYALGLFLVCMFAASLLVSRWLPPHLIAYYQLKLNYWLARLSLELAVWLDLRPWPGVEVLPALGLLAASAVAGASLILFAYGLRSGKRKLGG